MVMCVIDVGENSKKLSVNMLGGRREVLREITTYVTTTLLMVLLIKHKKVTRQLSSGTRLRRRAYSGPKS